MRTEFQGEGPAEISAGAALALFGALSVEAIAPPARRLEGAAPHEPLQAAASRMWWKQVGALAVLDGDRLVGSLSEDDLLRTLAARLEAYKADVESVGPELRVWDELLGGLSVADAMTPRAELPHLPASSALLEGVELVCAPTAVGGCSRHLWLMGDAGEVARVISIRDIARYLTALYDREFPADAFRSARDHERARRTGDALLDLSIGAIRERTALGHPPIVARLEASGAETVRRMWEDRRGYAIAVFSDGGPTGICTRRDVLRALRTPFVKLGELRAARLMTVRVKTVSDVDTLCGLFKLMAIEGCRHMPLVDEEDRVECVISMWEAVALLAAVGAQG